MDNDDPFHKPPARPFAYIQWKGTEVCLDFHCPCGELGHVDAGFAYYVRCTNCNQVFEMPWYVSPREVDEKTVDWTKACEPVKTE